MTDEMHAAQIEAANQIHASVLALEAQWQQEDEPADLHMSHRFYQSEDGAEWLLRTWEPDYPTKIRFIDVGPDRDKLLTNARAFWIEHIEPKRALREQAEAKRAEARRARAASFPTATAA